MPQDISDVHARNMDIPEEVQPMQGQSSIIASLDDDTYRSLRKDTSFPRHHFMARPSNAAEAFIGSLSMLGHGIPLWDARGNYYEKPEAKVKIGVSIGDVGFLCGEKGEFISYFNLFLSPDHPAQKHCPPDLIPLDPPLDAEVSVNPMHFPPGTVLVSDSIDASTLSSSPLDIQFTINAHEGGMLVFPGGASREDLLSTTRIRDYVKKHALNWYIFLNEKCGSVFHSNGTLYVVTGTDKATTWASCTTRTSRSRIRQMWKPSTTIYRGERENSVHQWEQVGRGYNWGLKHQRSREIEPPFGTFECALFVRGMRFAVDPRDWKQHLVSYMQFDLIRYSVIRTVPILGLRAKIQTFKECCPGYRQKVPHQDIREIFHPSDVILKLLLEESPTSTVAYVEDHIWCSVVDKGDACLDTIIRLLFQILSTHDKFVEDGMVTLLPRTPNSQEQIYSPFPNFWKEPSTYIKRKYCSWSHRRQISNRLAKVFPSKRVSARYLMSQRD